jgi:hypothetical protein
MAKKCFHKTYLNQIFENQSSHEENVRLKLLIDKYYEFFLSLNTRIYAHLMHRFIHRWVYEDYQKHYANTITVEEIFQQNLYFNILYPIEIRKGLNTEIDLFLKSSEQNKLLQMELERSYGALKEQICRFLILHIHNIQFGRQVKPTDIMPVNALVYGKSLEPLETIPLYQEEASTVHSLHENSDSQRFDSDTSYENIFSPFKFHNNLNRRTISDTDLLSHLSSIHDFEKESHGEENSILKKGLSFILDEDERDFSEGEFADVFSNQENDDEQLTESHETVAEQIHSTLDVVTQEMMDDY